MEKITLNTTVKEFDELVNIIDEYSTGLGKGEDEYAFKYVRNTDEMLKKKI